MWNTLLKLVGGKITALCSLLSSFDKYLKSFFYAITGKGDSRGETDAKSKEKIVKRDIHLDLFNQPSRYVEYTSTSKYLRQCAVSEFDYDFSSPNPFNWDFQNLVFSNQLNPNATLNTRHHQLQDPLTNNYNHSNNGLPLVEKNPANHIHDNNNTKANYSNVDSAGNRNNALDSGEIQEANQLLSQFSQNFRNNLKNNELYQIYQNQNNERLQLQSQSHFQDGNLFPQNHSMDLSIHHNPSDDDAEFSDDEFDDYLVQNNNFNSVDLSAKNNIINNNVANNYIDERNNVNFSDDDENLPLDDELRFSLVRNSNPGVNNFQLCYFMSDTSELTNSPIRTSPSENNSEHSHDEVNLLKREIQSEEEEDDDDDDDDQSQFDGKHNYEFAGSHGAKNMVHNKLFNSTKNGLNSNSRKKHKNNAMVPSIARSESDLELRSDVESRMNKEMTTDQDEDNKDTEKDKLNGKGNKLYVCPICDTTFKVKGYLTRHKKKHFASKPFQCPYFDSSVDYNEHNHPGETSEKMSKIPRCHPTGGFSRRDTFKTHLKALHFVYPTGTKSGDRSDKKGRCAACFKEFKTNKEWLETHVMTNECEGMIIPYK